MTLILGIESSCDDSGIALWDPQQGFLGEWVHRQTATHVPYGGVVPDLASREHMAWLPNLLREAQPILQANPPSAIAVTVGPGLPGSLGVGIAFAQAVSIALNCPIYGVNHLHGHAFSPFIPLWEQAKEANLPFESLLESHLPHLGILVSGSNTLLFSIRKDRSFQILAETVDDALGEALDKAAKLMGMPYPGGPLVEKLAQAGDPKRHPFPQAFPQADIPKFSFSGLKTSLRYLLEKMDDATFEAERPHLAASFQKAAFEPVLKKAHHHLKHGGFRSLGLSGGVANNECLRQGCAHLAEKHHIPLLLAHKKHTADNASMIAFAHWLSPFKPLSGKILEPSLRLT